MQLDGGGGHFATIHKFGGLEFQRLCYRVCSKLSTLSEGNTSNKQPPATLHPIKVAHIFQPPGNRFYRTFKTNYSLQKVYIIVAIEYLTTKWAKVKTVEQDTAPKVQKFLIKLVFLFDAFDVPLFLVPCT